MLMRIIKIAGIALALLLAGQSGAYARAMCLSSIANYTDEIITYRGIDYGTLNQIIYKVDPGQLIVDKYCRDGYMGLNEARLSLTDDSDKELDEFVRLWDRIRHADTNKQYLMSDDNSCQISDDDECEQRFTYIYDFNNPNDYPDCWSEHHSIHKTVIPVQALVFKCTIATGGFNYQAHFRCLTTHERSAAEARSFNRIALPFSVDGCL